MRIRLKTIFRIVDRGMTSNSDKLHILIVGAGLGGAACAIACRRQGLKVTLFDQVEEFLPIGDSIGFGSNTTKLFKRWGMYDDLDAISCKATEVVVHNWDSKILGVDPTLGYSEEMYGHRSIIGHRGDLHLIFLDHCYKNGVDVRIGCKVTDYDVLKPSVFLESGEEIIGDAVIASDGVKSLGRQQVLGYFDKPIHSGYAVYRGYMDSGPFYDDPVVNHFVKNGDCMHVYIGPNIHGFVTSLRNGTQINAVLTHKDAVDIEEGWSFPGEKEDILALIKGWDPAFVRVWEKMTNILDWKLIYRPCLTKWVADSGLVAVMGDAAHPFLPTSSQGASQAIEDGATIAMCLAKAGKRNVPLALRTYFDLRYEYVSKAQGTGISQREKWHNMHDRETGEIKQELDLSNGVLDSYYLWFNDCEQVVTDRWDTVSAKVKERLEQDEHYGRVVDQLEKF